MGEFSEFFYHFIIDFSIVFTKKKFIIKYFTQII